MMRAKNAPRLSRPNRSFLPRQGREAQAEIDLILVPSYVSIISK
jgi:hypothetical protein